MRRALIVSTAILVLFATSAVMAGEQQVSDRLLEILKDRQIISENEFAELSDIADQMQDDQTRVDQRLTALDASITDYLAKEGDEAGVATKHKMGSGFGFATGNFELWVGGLFQFEYFGINREDAQDTNNFRVKEARFYFKGKAFVEGFTYKFQWKGNGGVSLLDAYGNYVITEGVQIRFGQFKIPYSRQALNSTGKLEFMNRSIVVDTFAPGRDIGIMGHDVVNFGENENDMALEWAFGLFNGDGTNVSGNDNNWLGWCARLGFYPMGFVQYGETDFAQGDDVKFGIAGSYYSVRNRPSGNTVKRDQWEIDAVVTWAGLYGTGEYHSATINPDGESSTDYTGWFLQAGYLIADTNIEVMARYSYIDWDRDTGLKNTKEWVIGAAWYPEGFGHPFKIVIQFSEIKSDTVDRKGGSGPITKPYEYDYDIGYSDFYAFTDRVRYLSIGFQLDW
jgi:hypothetical protein